MDFLKRNSPSIYDIPLDRIIFIDIETVPEYKDYNNVPEYWQKLWDEKAKKINQNESSDKLYHRAGIYAEFGKIICICAGRFVEKNSEKILNIKGYFSNNESELLKKFFEDIQKFENHFKNDGFKLCAHNGKEFDFPFICRRAIINKIKLPKIFKVAGFKPYEVPFIDTMELWKFGDHKSYTSLELLSYAFGIESPKNKISGANIYELYYNHKNENNDQNKHDNKNNITEIIEYCKKDVETVAKIFLFFRQDYHSSFKINFSYVNID